jgi:hypothetical protein
MEKEEDWKVLTLTVVVILLLAVAASIFSSHTGNFHTSIGRIASVPPITPAIQSGTTRNSNSCESSDLLPVHVEDDVEMPCGQFYCNNVQGIANEQATEECKNINNNNHCTPPCTKPITSYSIEFAHPFCTEYTDEDGDKHCIYVLNTQCPVICVDPNKPLDSCTCPQPTHNEPGGVWVKQKDTCDYLEENYYTPGIMAKDPKSKKTIGKSLFPPFKVNTYCKPNL